MPRGVPKSASATSVPSASTRSTAARSAKIKANMSLMDHADADYDALIRKHDKKGARGFAKARETATTSAAKTRMPMSPITTVNKGKAPAIVKDDRKQSRDDEEEGTRHDVTTTTTTAETKANVSTAKRRTKKTTKAKEMEAKAPEDVVMEEGGGADAQSEEKSGEPSSSSQAAKPKKAATKATKKATTAKSAKTKATSTKTTAKSRTRAGKAKVHEEQDVAEQADEVMAEAGANLPSDPGLPAQPTTPEKGKAKATDAAKRSPEKAAHKTKIHSSSSSTSPAKGRRVKASPQKAARPPPAMSEVQVQSFLANYDLEAENRIRIAIKTLQISIDSARTQMHAKAIAKLPRAVRLMKLGDFVHEYGADVQAALERAAVTANRAREGEWEEEKLQRKRKGANEEGDAEEGRGKDKNQRTDKDKQPAAGAKRTKGRVVSSSAARRAAPSKVPVLSPVRQTSTVNPPTASSFAPRLAPAAQANAMPPPLATPARGPPRAARTGEQVQYLSLNGSPIIGVIAPDGTVHAMPRTVGSPSKRKVGTTRAELQEDEEDAAETSAHLLELALGIDEQQKKRSRTQKVPSESPASQSSMHTADGSRQSRTETESDDGADVFEEALSLPDDDDAGSLPDEEAYTAQILREEAARRERARASTAAGAARSSSSIGNSSNASFGVNGGTATARNSASTIRPSALQRKALAPAVTNAAGRGAPQIGSSSPMIKSRFNTGLSSESERAWRSQASAAAPPSSSSSSSSGALPASSSPSKGRVSIVFGSGSQQRITHLGVEDLMRLPSHERTQMLEILEKLRKAQRASAD